MKCNHCGKSTFLSRKKKFAHPLTGEIELVYHKECYLKIELDRKDRELYELYDELGRPEKINTSMLSKAKEMHYERNPPSKKQTILTVSPEIEDELLKNSMLTQHLEDDPQGNEVMLGMKIRVDNRITGWFLK